MNRLRKSERCPLHGRLHCCGRTKQDKPSKSLHYEIIAPGVKRFPDGRESCTAAALKKRKDALLRQSEVCVFCGKDFTDYRDVDLCHIESKGAGGWKHNDALSNLTLGHHSSNLECGSRSIQDYKDYIECSGKKFPCEEESQNG